MGADNSSEQAIEDVTSNLNVAQQIMAGGQMLFVAFGALVLMPLITSLDPNVALFTAGIVAIAMNLILPEIKSAVKR